MRIGTVRSFHKPNKRYAIFRNGKSLKDGGQGVEWNCKGCDSDHCIHLKFLWAYSKANKLNMLVDANIVSLTLRGKKFFRYDE